MSEISRRTALRLMGGAAAVGLSGLGQSVWAEATPCHERPAHCGEWEALARYIDTDLIPIPDGNPPPFQPGSPESFAAFRQPYPRVPVWNPPGPKRVGIQAGHWKYDESPEELKNNRLNPGTSGGGKAEWEVNLDIAQRVVDRLREEGHVVDLLDGTPPIRYRAHLFLAIHADGDLSQQFRGYKVGSARFSSTPEADKELCDALWEEYGAVTDLQKQPNQVSNRMTGYYAFNSRRYQHAIAPGVPHAIIETAFLTNPIDREFLFRQPDRVARGIVDGLRRYLDSIVPPVSNATLERILP
ncbi:MAG: N-acetylmuramoyl-L-alanine amidase [Dehalococcoidia bacterium]